MKVLIAPNSFKGFLSSPAAARIMRKALEEAAPGNCYEMFPLADGGDGFVDTLTHHFNYNTHRLCCRDISGKVQGVPYAVDGDRVYLEMAAVSGYGLLRPEERRVERLSTYELGLLAQKLYMAGKNRLCIGLGGSASNDCGLGMLAAMGCRFLDSRGKDLFPGRPIREVLEDTVTIDRQALRYPGLRIELYCDVDNLLIGSAGAVRVYGPQKGIAPTDLPLWDKACARFLRVLAHSAGKAVADKPGFGAAGGIGAGLHYLLDAELRMGVDLFLEQPAFKDKVNQADLVVTGEGKLDRSSFYHKATGALYRTVRRMGKQVVFLVGVADALPDEDVRVFAHPVAHPTYATVARSLRRAALDLGGTL